MEERTTLRRMAWGLGEVAEFHEGVDEEAQALLGRQPACGNMWSVDEAKLFEVAHHVADCGGRER